MVVREVELKGVEIKGGDEGDTDEKMGHYLLQGKCELYTHGICPIVSEDNRWDPINTKSKHPKRRADL